MHPILIFELTWKIRHCTVAERDKAIDDVRAYLKYAEREDLRRYKLKKNGEVSDRIIWEVYLDNHPIGELVIEPNKPGFAVRGETWLIWLKAVERLLPSQPQTAEETKAALFGILRLNPWAAVQDETDRKIVQLANEGKTKAEIAQKIGISEKTVQNRASLIRKYLAQRFGPGLQSEIMPDFPRPKKFDTLSG